ncbi:MAG: hypothetical protein ACC726_07605 [Chloroflexota bacterium]
MQRLPFQPLAVALVAVGVVTYVLCVAAGVLWPAVFKMSTLFPTIFPGFTWIDPLSFLVGLAEVTLYALGGAAVAAIAWNAATFRERHA